MRILLILLIVLVSSCRAPIFITKQNIELYQIIDNEKIGYIDQKGKLRINTEFESCFLRYDSNCCTQQFDSNDFAVIKLNSKFGLINWRGDIVLKPAYDFLEPRFYDEDKFSFIASLNGKYGIINHRGEILIPFIFDNRFFFPLNKKMYGKINGKTIIYDPKTHKRIKSQHDMVTPFFEHYSVIQKNGKYGLIDTNLIPTIEPKYDHIGFIKKGLINVKADNRWIYINPNDKVVIDDDFEEASSFEDGIATVKKNKFGAIDSTGKIIIPFKYEYLSYQGKDSMEQPVFLFSNQEDFFSHNLRVGLINIKRDTILKPEYSDIFYFDDIAEVTNPSGKSGVINLKDNTVLIPDVFDFIDYYEYGLTKVYYTDENGNYFGYLNRKNKIVWAQNKRLLSWLLRAKG